MATTPTPTPTPTPALEPTPLPPIQISLPLYKAFSVTELSAAEQLVQMSSSCDSGDGAAPQRTALSSASSSSPLSVGTRPPAAEEDEEACVGPQRRVERYRLVADVYATTKPIARPKKRNRNKGLKKEEMGWAWM